METPPPGSVSACSVTSIAVLSGTWTRKKSTSPAGEIAPSWTPAAMSVAVAGVLLGSVSATVGVMVGRAVGAIVGVVVGATVAAAPATVGATRIGSAGGGGSTRATPLTRPDGDNSGDAAPSTGIAAMTAAAAIGGCDGLAGPGKVVGAGVGTENCEPASARTKSPDRAKRSSGLLASARRSAASTPGGNATPSWLGSGTGLFTWAISAERGLSEGNGWRPTSIWYAMMPSAYWSAAGPALSAPPASSGAM